MCQAFPGKVLTLYSITVNVQKCVQHWRNVINNNFLCIQ